MRKDPPLWKGAVEGLGWQQGTDPTSLCAAEEAPSPCKVWEWMGLERALLG